MSRSVALLLILLMPGLLLPAGVIVDLCFCPPGPAQPRPCCESSMPQPQGGGVGQSCCVVASAPTDRQVAKGSAPRAVLRGKCGHCVQVTIPQRDAASAELNARAGVLGVAVISPAPASLLPTLSQAEAIRPPSVRLPPVDPPIFVPLRI